MKTYMAHPETVERKWYLVDANGMPFGRLASQVAAILRGKNKPTFTPNVDTGDYVIVINSDKAVLTGKKLTQKYFKTYSGYQGGLKETQFKKMMEEKSDVALLRAIKGMLPKNALGRDMARKVKIYKGAEHPHEAQQPELITLKGGTTLQDNDTGRIAIYYGAADTYVALAFTQLDEIIAYIKEKYGFPPVMKRFGVVKPHGKEV